MTKFQSRNKQFERTVILVVVGGELLGRQLEFSLDERLKCDSLSGRLYKKVKPGRKVFEKRSFF